MQQAGINMTFVTSSDNQKLKSQLGKLGFGFVNAVLSNETKIAQAIIAEAKQLKKSFGVSD